jgi:hypothetical protein
MHAYRRRNQIILFDQVNINTQIEVETSGQTIVKSLLVRAANRKSVEQLSQEIRAGQHRDAAGERRYRGISAFLAIPGPIRSVLSSGHVEPDLVQAVRRDRRHELDR